VLRLRANTIGELYKARWEVEIFFRDIKQQLHIKSFIGTSENAVMIQIWTALITILILKALKIELHKWLDNPFAKEQPPPDKAIQGVLF